MPQRIKGIDVTEALNPDQIVEQLKYLDPSWSSDASGLKREVKFKSYLDSVRFFDLLAPICEEMNHHPDIVWSYSSVKISLLTHSAGTVTNSDFKLAKRIDTLLKSHF